jgi:hypothetical protein
MNLGDQRVNYTREQWVRRHHNRSDISIYLTHLTKGIEGTDSNSIDVLIRILNERKLNGSSKASGFISGSNPAVCFQEAPLQGVCQNLMHEMTYREQLGGKKRYSGNGLTFQKSYVYNKGGRPVIYEKSEEAKRFLSREEWWRIVSYDIGDDYRIIDWSHEREWRHKGHMEFELSEAYVLLSKKESYKYFIEQIDPVILKNIAGIIVLNPLIL